MMPINRRRFVENLSVAAVASGLASLSLAKPQGETETASDLFRLKPFDLDKVALLSGPVADQYQKTREFYWLINNDDILKGFREYAGMPSPGNELGGWCNRDASEVFGQWLSGMSRMYRATNDFDIRNKAEFLMTEWGKTLKGNAVSGLAYYTERKGHYLYDKNVCGLTDMGLYGQLPEAWRLLERVTDWAEKNLSRQRRLATSDQRQANFDGHSMEWYTLSENLYRAWRATGNSTYKSFGDVWRYEQYWSKFYSTASPSDAFGVHAYSHVNTFSSAAMSYVASNDIKYLNAVRNAFNYILNTQSFVTGGYGPEETLVSPGQLGESLEWRSDSAECPCGAWAGFKLSQYLTELTGEAYYGDLAELLLYNVMMAVLPMSGNGNTFYYADYRVGGGMKTYRWDTWPCCSGTFIQNVAGYSNFIYYQSDAGLFVNLFVPSKVEWNGLEIRQTTLYPESEEITFHISGSSNKDQTIHLRIPKWCESGSLRLNGSVLPNRCRPGSWVAVSRAWRDGDTLVLTLPMSFRVVAVDEQHPKRIAVMYGPVALAQDARTHQRFVPGANVELLDKQLQPGEHPLEFLAAGSRRNRFRPFYTFGERVPYWMYFDVA